MRDRPICICSFLAGEPKTWSSTSLTVRLLIPLLLVLEASEHPSCLTFLEGTIHVPFDGEYPSSSDKVAAVLFSHVNKVKDIVFEPTLILGRLSLAKLLGVISEVGCSGFLSCPIDLRLGHEGGRSGKW